MKKVLLISFLIMNLVVNSQTSNAKLFIYQLNPSHKSKSIQNQKIAYKNYFVNAYFYDLQIYNPSIGLFENYNYVTENQFERADKMDLAYSKTLFLSSNVSSLSSPFFGHKPDSFNPSGATDFKSALGVGLINLLLNKSSFHIQH